MALGRLDCRNPDPETIVISNQEQTIDKATFKVNLGILATLIAGATGSSFYLSTLNGDVKAIISGQAELKRAIEKNTDQLSSGQRSIAVLEMMVKTIERRVGVLEGK